MRETCMETWNPGTAEVLHGQTGVREVKSQLGCGGPVLPLSPSSLSRPQFPNL